MAEKVPTVRVQGGELFKFMGEMVNGGSKGEGRTEVTVVMGDFNIRAGEGDYNFFSERLASDHNLVDITVKKGGGWDTTFGVKDKDGNPVETLLTSPGLRGKVSSCC